MGSSMRRLSAMRRCRRQSPVARLRPSTVRSVRRAEPASTPSNRCIVYIDVIDVNQTQNLPSGADTVGMALPPLPHPPSAIAATDLTTLVDHAQSVQSTQTLNDVHDAFGRSGPKYL